jgi:hypothetical protein
MASHDAMILGLAAGYHHGDVRPFLASLRASGFAGRCALFVSATTRDAERMADFGVKAVPFARPEHQNHVPLNAWRYFLYREYLAGLQRPPQTVLLTDVRDVVFQADLLAGDWEPGLHLFLEDAAMGLGQCPWCARWVRGHLGGAALELLAPHPVACSGTTLGDAGAVAAYLELMVRHLLPFTPGERMAGYDQGVHNWLLRTGRLSRVRLHDNAGPVLTLGRRTAPPALDARGLVCNDAGAPAALVHQYDRHPALHRLLRQRF